MTLDRFMGRELRARYLNPKWIEAMLQQGYAGARFIRQVTDNLWGWQVTVPESVDAAKWQELFETYVEDRYHLDIRGRFQSAANLAAFDAILERMLTVIEKGYWAASPATVERLRSTRTQIAPAIAAEATTLAERAEARLGPAPGVAPNPMTAAHPPAASARPMSRPTGGAAPARAAAAVPVSGRVLEEGPRTGPARARLGRGFRVMTWLAGASALGLLVLGWCRRGRELNRA